MIYPNWRSLCRYLSLVSVIWLGIVLNIHLQTIRMVKRANGLFEAVVRFSVLPTLVFGTISFLLYAYDKLLAKWGARRRVPESTFHLLSLLGGWPGASIGQQLFRHKCSKVEFLKVHIATVVCYFVFSSLLLKKIGY